MKIFFIGAGPGARDLITLRGKSLIESAAVIMYAGSLVNPELLEWAPPRAEVHDTSGMDLDAICGVFKAAGSKEGHIARLHTGDPCLYGAIAEQIEYCRREGIDWEVVPGVSSFTAAAATLGRELTLPGISQTVILTRKAGRTPVPERQELKRLAATGSTLVLFLSAGLAASALEDIQPEYHADTPAAAVYRAGWPQEKVLEATVATLAEAMKAAGIDRQAIILVGKAIRPGGFEASKLYDPHFTHGYRKGRNV